MEFRGKYRDRDKNLNVSLQTIFKVTKGNEILGDKIKIGNGGQQREDT